MEIRAHLVVKALSNVEASQLSVSSQGEKFLKSNVRRSLNFPNEGNE